MQGAVHPNGFGWTRPRPDDDDGDDIDDDDDDDDNDDDDDDDDDDAFVFFLSQPDLIQGDFFHWYPPKKLK